MADLEGLRVTCFESRMASEMIGLVERMGGSARSAPAMRELPAPVGPNTRAFAEQLIAGQFDIVVFLTGVGAGALMSLIEPYYPRPTVIEALSKTVSVVRGPKPLAVLRGWHVKPTLQAGEPNTWREVLEVLVKAGPLTGKRIAIQEYGEPNLALVEALEAHGAEVAPVPVYTWALPEDLEPLREAIRALCDGRTEVVAFTSAQQARNVLQVAADMGVENGLREALKGTVIGSIGPTASAALRQLGLGVDFEPDRTRMGHLVRGLARSATTLLRRKRASLEVGIDTSRAGRLELIWPADECGATTDPLHDSAFLRACRREKTEYTPIWLMRQAGRYQRAYREIRSKVSFLEMCKRPDLAAEVTVMAVEQLGVDAAIIFSDILLIVEPMGVGLSYQEGHGPMMARPVRTSQDVDNLPGIEPVESLACVFEAIRMARRALHPAVPLIGFCGAPFTIASYLIEGRSSRDFRQTKTFMYRDPGAWYALMDRLVCDHAKYLNAQIDAGVQAVQLFDSWVGCLNEADYREFVMPHMHALIHAIKPGVPIIHFGTNTATILKAIKQAGGDVIGLDWRVDLAEAWQELGHDVAVQGNFDPVVLFATPARIRKQAQVILDQAAGRPGHIFNLGHGILPDTPVDHVIALVDGVHDLSRR
ncbi:MAG TPA: uroporphyrinogen decarboxylase [Phycisphaerae bacterium]|nr:uroporphyrinogen decarboxylase [Phycisphaerae bacterium]HRY69928.1 uroporphyrinogen decarboxylase [Phycisphaerae bacterium]HSA27137.1 uroporphyrinogen decarboxylase [Phycisphaerae bacterium]